MVLGEIHTNICSNSINIITERIITMIISLSGIDGSGKSTQIRMLADQFISNGKNVITYNDIPNTEPILSFNEYLPILMKYDIIILRPYVRSKQQIMALSKLVDNGILSNMKASLSYDFRQQFYNDTQKWHKLVINPLLKSKKTIIYDRFLWDEIPYRVFYNIPTNDIYKLLHEVEMPISFYLMINYEKMYNRNLGRGDLKKEVFRNYTRINLMINYFNSFVSTKVNYVIDGELHKSIINKMILEKLGGIFQ